MSLSKNIEYILSCAGQEIDSQIEKLAEKLSKRFNLDVKEVIECIHSVENENSTEKTKISAKSIKKTKEEAVKTCGRQIRGKGACGRKASNEIDGVYYCGNYKDDGTATAHLKAALLDQTKKAETIGKEKPKVVSVTASLGTKKKLPHKKEKGQTLKKNEELSDERSKKLAQKKLPTSELNIQTIGDRRMDMTTRILFDGQKAYGILDKDCETILPFQEEHFVFLDRIGIVSCPIPMIETSGMEENSDEEAIELDEEFILE